MRGREEDREGGDRGRDREKGGGREGEKDGVRTCKQKPTFLFPPQFRHTKHTQGTMKQNVLVCVCVCI